MIAASGGNDHRCVRACGLHSDSRFYTATVGMHEDSGEQKEDSLSLSLSLFSFTHLAFLSSFYVLVYTHVHTYTPVESVHIYIHTRTDVRSSFAVAKGKSGSLKAGG